MKNKMRNSRFEQLLLSPHWAALRHLMIQGLIFFLSLNAFGGTSEIFVFNGEHLRLWIVFYLMINLVCYLNMYLFVPRWFLTRQVGKYILAILLSIMLFMFAMMAFQPHEGILPTSILFAVVNLFTSFLTIGIVILSTTTWLLFRYWTAEQHRVRALNVSTKAYELEFLKQQINPHFLFNTLNNANVLLMRNPEEASRVLFKLEDLLRYQLKDCSRTLVPLSQDIQFLNDYLNLEKIRRDHFDYTLNSTFFASLGVEMVSWSQIWVPPLLFIVFVENAVKHNPDSGASVQVSFSMEKEKLCFCCENVKSATPLPHSVGGLGLKNVRRRLELLYPEHYRLDISDGETRYRVSLEIHKESVVIKK